MSSFNIKRVSSEIVIPEDSFESFLSRQERSRFIEILPEKQTEGEVPALYVLPSAFVELDAQIKWKAKTVENINEQGGILIGYVYKDKDSHLVCGVVQHIIASGKAGDATYIQFTHKDWITMYKEFEEKYASSNIGIRPLKVIGWYHTHPNMPVRMSGIDKKTHISFFPNEYQFSVILNPQQGTWAIFNGKECKNCNGILFCTHNEVEISKIQDSDSTREESNFPDESSSFVIKRISSVPVCNADHIYGSGNRSLHANNQQAADRYTGNIYNGRLMTQQYQDRAFREDGTCYHFPLNEEQIDSVKSYIIEDALIRHFASFVTDWDFSEDTSVALLYHLYEKQDYSIQINKTRYSTFEKNGRLDIDGFVFGTGSGGFIEYRASTYKRNIVTLAVIYTSRKLSYAVLCEIYGIYDCVLWVNPKNRNEFEFYAFREKTKQKKNGTLLDWEQSRLEQIVQIENDFLRNLIYNISPMSDYLQAEYDGITQRKPPLYISKKYIIKIFERIKRYNRISNNFTIIISFESSDIPTAGNNKMHPWLDMFWCVWIFEYDNNNNMHSICLKNMNDHGKTSKYSKLAFVLSNSDVNIDDFKNKLIGHRAAVCLNVETRSCFFYQLF